MKSKIILSLIIFLLVLLSFPFPGFINGHGGYAGPHLLSASLNSMEIDFLIRADAILFSGNDISYKSYNHHPPLSFWAFGLITSLVNTASLQLISAYLLSVVFNSLGIIALFSFLRSFNMSQKITLLICLSLLSTNLFLDYRNLATFDSLSVFSAVLILSQFVKIEKNNFNFFYTSSILFFTILISWYNLFLIATYFIIKFIIGCVKYKLLNYLKSKEFYLSLCLAFLSISLITILYFQINYINSISDSNFGLTRKFLQARETDINLYLIFKVVLKSFPVASLSSIIILIIFKKNIISVNKNKLNFLIIPIISFLSAMIIFFLLDPYWNLVHNYSFLYLSFFLSTFIFLLIDIKSLKVINGMIVINFIVFLLNLSFEFYRDFSESQSTLELINKVSKLNSEGKDYIYIENKYRDNIEKILNEGRLCFLASASNIKGFSNENKPEKMIVISYDESKNKIVIN